MRKNKGRFVSVVLLICIKDVRPVESLLRFLNGRDGSVSKAYKMRIENETDSILSKKDEDMEDDEPSMLGDDEIRVVLSLQHIINRVGCDRKFSHGVLVQMKEYRDRVIMESARKKFGRPVSTSEDSGYDCLKFSVRFEPSQTIQTAISTIDDLNYPEKTDTYYIVNAPYKFSACWKVVRPLLNKRTTNRVQVLPGCGKEELLKVSCLNEFGLILKVIVELAHGVEKAVAQQSDLVMGSAELPKPKPLKLWPVDFPRLLKYDPWNHVISHMNYSENARV
ncbi:hypothetical protein LguiA_002539 [Lonicera macranthoides]